MRNVVFRSDAFHKAFPDLAPGVCCPKKISGSSGRTRTYNPPVNSLAGCSKSNNFAAQMTTHGNTQVLEVANIVTPSQGIGPPFFQSLSPCLSTCSFIRTSGTSTRTNCGRFGSTTVASVAMARAPVAATAALA